MVLGIQVKVEGRALNTVLRSISKRLPKRLSMMVSQTATKYKASLRQQLLVQTKKAPRTAMAKRINTRKMSRFRSIVTLPISAVYLDRMKPHWVSLYRGRLITRWARLYFDGSPKYTGRSRVRRGPRGGIQGGSLFVHADPFIRTAILRINRQLPSFIEATVFRALKGV